MRKTLSILILFALGCKQPAFNGLSIDLIKLDKKSSVKFVLSQFVFDTETTSWNWQKIDSVFIPKNSRLIRLQWHKTFTTKFIATFNAYNDKGMNIGQSREFIYSDTPVIATTDPGTEPINIPGKYNNAITFNVTGGENAIFANKTFLSPPNIKGMSALLSSVRNSRTLTPDTTVQYLRWKRYEQEVIACVSKYPKDYYTVFSLISICDQLSPETLGKCLAELDSTLKKYPEENYLRSYFENECKLFVGEKLPDFNIQQGEGQRAFSAVTSKQKYYFIDFWASWCMPCRLQMQDLKTIYPSVDTNKVQFVSLSIDVNPTAWAAASREENIRWLSFLGRNNPTDQLMKKFALKYIPQNILIGPDRKIISKNIDVAQLRQYLAGHQLRIK